MGTREVPMGNKIPGNGKGHKVAVATAGKVKRRHEGPDTIVERVQVAILHRESGGMEVKYASDDKGKERTELNRKLNAQAEANEIGDLVVELPEVVTQLSDGQELRSRKRWMRQELWKVMRLAEAFIDVARTHQNEEAAAVGHILGAVFLAVRDDDPAALKEPEAWARKRLRPTEEDLARGAAVSPLYLPIETHDGKPLDIQSQISGGFHLLAAVIKTAIDKTRGKGHTLDRESRTIATSMAYNFPSLSSLSVAEPEEARGKRVVEIAGELCTVVEAEGVLLRIEQIEKRIKKPLRKQGEDRRAHPAEMAAEEIADKLLRAEFERSGKSAAEIRAAFKFRYH
jgi:hypothetical protein